MRDHPEIESLERTGYPTWAQDTEPDRCCECGRVIYGEVYECRTHETLCLECLKMLHAKYE